MTERRSDSSGPVSSRFGLAVGAALAAVMAVAVAAALLLRGEAPPSAPAAQAEPVRVGVLKFGTVSWELDVIRRNGLDAKEGIRIEEVPLASKNATAVALQGGAVDVIVTDWIWVSRQRAEGQDYTFVTHSVVAGGVLVRPDSGINSLSDLRGRKIGVAGGPVDKSWLLLRAYARKMLGADLAEVAQPVYGAPPLLNELMIKGELPAILTFWNFEAQLKASGMRQLLTIPELLRSFGADREVPVIGWVFRDKWAAEHKDALTGFLRASAAAKALLASSDEEWEKLKPLMNAPSEEGFRALRDAYRAGIPTAAADRQVASAKAIYGVLADLGGSDLVGSARELAPGTFWSGTFN